MIIQIAKPVLEQKKLYLITKRAFDIVCSFLGLLILAIPMIIIALIITLDSPGPPIFKQERLGLHGKPFMIYKFRSMRLDAEENGPQWADEQDPRCTHFGQILRRTRLDELPQFYNILRGDMSFVGPRPERAYFYGEFEKIHSRFLQPVNGCSWPDWTCSGEWRIFSEAGRKNYLRYGVYRKTIDLDGFGVYWKNDPRRFVRRGRPIKKDAFGGQS